MRRIERIESQTTTSIQEILSVQSKSTMELSKISLDSQQATSVLTSQTRELNAKFDALSNRLESKNNYFLSEIALMFQPLKQQQDITSVLAAHMNDTLLKHINGYSIPPGLEIFTVPSETAGL